MSIRFYIITVLVLLLMPVTEFWSGSITTEAGLEKKIYMNNKFIYEKLKNGALVYEKNIDEIISNQNLMFSRIESIENIGVVNE